MPQDLNLKIKGLYTAPNEFSGAPQGALAIADDIVIDQENLAESRRGFSYVDGDLPDSNDRVNNFVNYKDYQIISYSETNLAYYSSGWVTYSGTYLPPAANAQVRFTEANQNLYFSTSVGVYKLDVPTATPALAGVPKGLDLQLSLTGSSGFLGVNNAASVTGTTTSGSANLTLLSSITGISVGQYIQGTGITAGTTVSSITTSSTVASGSVTTAIGSTTITAINATTGFEAAVVAGQFITGTGIPSGARIVSVNTGAHTAVISLAATAAGTITATLASDPIVTMSANASASGSVAINFGAGSQVAYRLVWGIKDANNNVITGYPSQFASITNNTGITANVSAVTSIPSGITTAHFYQLYRSAQTVSASITPLDDEQLVYEGNPSSGDIAAGYITITDITPDSLRGAFLYTSISQQGISQGNERPPYCKDFCNFRGYNLYANVKSKQQLKLTILSTVASTGITSGDTLTIGGIVFTADSTENTATGHFKVYTTGTPAQNISNTANSLIKVINRYATNTAVYAYLLSGPTDLPGQILLEEKGNNGATFYALASAHGSAYSPALPTSGTTVASAQNIYKNGIIVSKQSEPEHVPSSNLFFAGNASQEILRIIPLRDYVIICKEDGIYRLSGLTLQTFLISPFDLTTTLIAPNTATTLSNEVWGLFDQGVCSISDTGVNVKSRPIEDTLRALIGTALDTIETVAFGIGYETDRKYILAMPSADGDEFSQQQFVFSEFTNTWVRWTRSCTAGFVDKTSDRLYLGNGNSETVSVENKTDTYQDYVDEPFDVNIVSSDDYEIVLSSVTGISIGDVLYDSSTVASVISDIDVGTNTVTVEDLLTWPTGAAQVYPAITNVIQWLPIVAGNPSYVRQYSEGSFIFKRTRFNVATASFYSDVDQAYEDTEIEGFGIANWGNFGWGQENWGGVNRGKSIRFLVPQNKQVCSQLSTKLTIRNGYSNWALQGIASSFVDISQEIAN